MASSATDPVTALNLKGWQQENAELQDELNKYKKIAMQRGARMQIMREWMMYPDQPSDGWDWFVAANPSASRWFDKDGVPVDA